MFVLTPRPAPAYQASGYGYHPFGFCGPASQPVYNYRISHPRPQPRRPQYALHNNLFSQVDELLSEIDREAQRQAQLEAHLEAQRKAHRQRQQQRKQALRARFAVNQTEQGWQIDGDIQGFTQQNINVEITDEHTLKISGNTEQQSESVTSETHDADSAAIAAPEEPQHDAESGDTTESSMEASQQESDTESHRSYQPTVEDDYEDLGAETSSLISASSGVSHPATPAEPKGKEKAVDQITATTATAVVQQSNLEAPVHQQQAQEEKRIHGTFQRTFRFPQRIDVNNVSASFKEGVLRINVPRPQAPQSRRIVIL